MPQICIIKLIFKIQIAMNTIAVNYKIKLLGVLFLSIYISNAQVIYQDQLETVYLNDQIEEVVYRNDFSNFNNQLVGMKKINFRSEIKKAKESQHQLFFLSERSTLEIWTESYLKTIRKGANRNTDSQSFKRFLQNRIPELMYQLEKDNNIEELYFLTRKNTFNGKINALPSVI